LELSVLRLRKPEPQKVTLSRAVVKYPAITSKLLPDDIGLIQIQSLDGTKVDDVAAALAQLQKQGAKKFLLDLRNSAAGKPEDGATLANLFLEKGTLTYLQGQKIPRQNFDADPAKALYKQQLVLITNRGTATAAEVAAAALLDSKRVEIVGERTYGDAAMRRAISMDDGGAVILSVAKYYSPSGKAIQDTGVTPTILVTDSDGAAETDDEAQPDAPKKEGDALMKRAIEVLTKGKTQQTAKKE